MTAPYDPETLPAACFAFTAPFEGNELFPYLDGNGNITCAIGDMLPDVQALADAFQVDLPAAQTAWDDLKSCPQGFAAPHYQGTTGLRLTPARAMELFEQCAPKYIGMCERNITNFWGLDGNAQKAAFDVFYNAGYFRRFCAALSVRDYASAAAQCHRKETPDPITGDHVPGGISKARNDATKALILTCMEAA